MATATPAKKKPLEHLRRFAPGILILILACLLFYVIVWWKIREPKELETYSVDEPSSPSFTGNSNQLSSTIIVPTLDTAFPANRSAIWAASSNLAWKELHQLAGGDVVIDGLPELSGELNRGVLLKPEMEKDHFFAAAGLKSKGIYEEVNKVLAKRFPSFQIPPPPESPTDSILAFACFKIAMKYQLAFLNDEEPMVFRDSQGNKTKVKSFGIRKKEARYDTMRNQVGTFFHDGKGHYAIDISTGMKPYQVILASIERGSTLKETLENFDKTKSAIKQDLSFGNDSILSVPNMEWTIDHSYTQLIGEVASGPKLPDAIQFSEALQRIEFRMDRTGVSVSSSMRFEASILNGDEVHRTGHYIFDQPYVIIIRRRNVSDPIFVMWVDNAEMLKKW